MNKLKKIAMSATTAILLAMSSVPVLASSVPNYYEQTATSLQTEADKMVVVAVPLVTGISMAGLGIFAIFLFFRLSKRGINAALSGH